MNAIKDTWRQLVRRRLWPVAVLLLGALVAVPVVLAKTPDPAAPAPVVKAETDDAAATYVARAETGESTERRRVLGAAKDPFEPKALPKVKKKSKAKKAPTDAETATPATPTTPTTPTTPDTSGSTGGASADPATPTVPPVSPAPTATPAPTIPAYSVKVRFGTVEESSAELPTKTAERLTVLPDEENPVLVYRGVQDGGKVAVFELTGNVDAEGDGTCEPTPEDCQYVKLRAGETEFITVTDTGEVTDAQYQLDLVKIYLKKTTEKAEPLAKGLPAKLDGVSLRKRNRYVFDETTGTLHRARGKTRSGSL